jgi:hypothetical protein
VLSVTTVDKVHSVAAAIRRRYGTLLGRVPWVYEVTPAGIAGEVKTS